MSMVTNYILTCGPLEDDEARDSDDCPAVNWINERLRGRLGAGCDGEFARVDQHAGGSKAFEADVFLCAMNYGRPDIVAPVIERAPWRNPEDVRLFVCEQEDAAFEPYPLKIAGGAYHALCGIGIHQPFFATVNGVRSRFFKLEHNNVGPPGWACREIDGKLPPRLYSSSEMTDVRRDG